MIRLLLYLLTVQTGAVEHHHSPVTFATVEECLAYAEHAMALTGGGRIVVAAATCRVDHF